jgi:hypothetical protein
MIHPKSASEPSDGGGVRDPAIDGLTGGMPWKQVSAFASDEDLKAIYACTA